MNNKQEIAREANNNYMAKHRPSIEAIRRFRTPAYGAVGLIRAQGEQMQLESAENWLKRKGVKVEKI